MCFLSRPKRVPEEALSLCDETSPPEAGLWFELRKRVGKRVGKRAREPSPRCGVSGVWRSRTRENGDAFFKLLGMNYVLRTLVLRATQVEVHEHNEDTDAYTIVEKRYNGDYKVAFTVGQDFDYTTQSGEVCRSTSQWLRHEEKENPRELELCYVAKEGWIRRRLRWDRQGMLETLELTESDRTACMTTRWIG